MKVYVKKSDKNTMIPGIIVTIVFLSFSIGMFISVITSGKSFNDVLAAAGILLIAAIMFFGFGMFFVYALFKRPKGYKAKLINKISETYNGKQITYMEFQTQKEQEQEEDFIPSDYNCYTIGENNLIVGNDYSLKVKEINWEPKFVEEISNSSEKTKNKVADKVPNMTMTPIFLAVGVFFGGDVLFAILGIIKYPQYTYIYMLVGFLCGMGAFRALKACKIWKIDNNIQHNEKDFNLELEKIKPIDNKQKKVGNIVIRYFLILLIVFPIIWFMILLKMDITKEDFMITFPMILFVELPIIAVILYNIGYDGRLIKRHKINVSENINIPDIKYFKIFRATKDTNFPRYFIIDQNRNLIFQIKRSNFIGNKFVICNPKNIKVGEIETKLFSLTNEFIVNIINEKTFIVRSKMQLQSSYQVIGRDYYVKGDTHLVRNIICDKESDIAYIYAISKHNNNWHELGNMEITLNNDVNNSIDIIMIALCVTMGNIQTFDEHIDKS